MGFLTVKSLFLGTFSLGTWYAFNFLFKKYLPGPLLYIHVVNPGQERQEADFRARAGWPWNTCCASSEHEISNMCWPFPLTARWKAQLPLRPRMFMALCRGPEFPLILLFIFHMIHIVWGFNFGSPGKHFYCRHLLFIPHIFVKCLVCTWKFLDAGNLRMNEG